MGITRRWVGLAATLCVACPSAPQATPPAAVSTSASASNNPAAPATRPSAGVLEAASAASVATAPKVPKPSIRASEAERILFLKKPPAEIATCRSQTGDAKQIQCLLALLYGGDPQALKAAQTLYAEAGIVAGVEPRQTMDGGWRGMLELVPEPARGRHRRHLLWLVTAYRDFARFFANLEERGGATPQYRHAPVRLRFFRSVGRTTPSAYASGWTVAYNVSGSLHTTADAVRETMFHETFHLNDSAHGRWSAKALTTHYEAVLRHCTKNKRLSTACLRPYAPNETMVRGGTYYAFQPGNGVWEYAAELAIRYYREHRVIFAGDKLVRTAFKCGPLPNATTWKLLADEFFAGIDLVPPC